jgi:hypothetical protein
MKHYAYNMCLLFRSSSYHQGAVRINLDLSKICSQVSFEALIHNTYDICLYILHIHIYISIYYLYFLTIYIYIYMYMYIRSGPCGRPRRVRQERFVFEGTFLSELTRRSFFLPFVLIIPLISFAYVWSPFSKFMTTACMLLKIIWSISP